MEEDGGYSLLTGRAGGASRLKASYFVENSKRMKAHLESVMEWPISGCLERFESFI
jgi:hypothetical protein